MQKLPVLLALLLGLSLAACGAGGDTTTDLAPLPPPDGGDPPPDGSSMSPTEYALALQVLDLTNRERAAVQLPPFTWDETAAEVAYLHSRDMDLRDFFSHTNPDGDLPWDRMRAAGMSFSWAGENIAYGYPSAAAVMNGWMTSTGHRENILRPEYTHLGVGVHVSPQGTIYWTQVFFTP